MQTVTITLDYLPIEALIDLIDEPNRSICHRILSENRECFEKASGSTHNHQAWDGGYIDHITDGMNYARHLYTFDKAFGRPLPFRISDALLIFFLHDLEKPWRIQVDTDGNVSNREGFTTKADSKKFKLDLIASYRIILTLEQLNALTYVEGELDDYTNKRRVMNELAAFCHKVDVWSARGWYSYPKEIDDEWIGARRFRTL